MTVDLFDQDTMGRYPFLTDELEQSALRISERVVTVWKQAPITVTKVE
jgi:hypothetical protein